MNFQEINDSLKKVRGIGFLGPFERYKLVKPFIQAEEERLASEKAKMEERTESSVQSSASNAVADSRTDEERIESVRAKFAFVLNVIAS